MILHVHFSFNLSWPLDSPFTGPDFCVGNYLCRVKWTENHPLFLLPQTPVGPYLIQPYTIDQDKPVVFSISTSRFINKL